MPASIRLFWGQAVWAKVLCARKNQELQTILKPEPILKLCGLLHKKTLPIFKWAAKTKEEMSHENKLKENCPYD